MGMYGRSGDWQSITREKESWPTSFASTPAVIDFLILPMSAAERLMFR